VPNQEKQENTIFLYPSSTPELELLFSDVSFSLQAIRYKKQQMGKG